MWVTIYSDASYNQKTKLSTYAYYIKSNQGLLKSHGTCPEYVKNISDAEAYAAIIAMGKAISSFTDISAICINTDCTYVIQKMSFNPIPKIKNPKIKDLILRARAFVKSVGIDLSLKHVKAHTGGGDIRSWCNKICDKGARKAMGKALKKKRNEDK